jgi:hypothetical protein
MTKLVLTLALLFIGATAGAFGLVFFKPARVAVERAVVPGPLSRGHAYLSERCETCHAASEGVTVDKCTACHATSARLLGRQPTAFHASVEECSTCHLEHQGRSIRPMLMDHLALARIGMRTLERASPRDGESAATLHSLKTWLQVPGPGKLSARSARESLDCAACHDSKDPHFKKLGTDCAQCHGLETWKVSRYQHPAPGNRECVQCHQSPPSHSMEHFKMISQKFAHKENARLDQCFECHNTTSWNDIVDVGFYKHH